MCRLVDVEVFLRESVLLENMIVIPDRKVSPEAIKLSETLFSKISRLNNSRHRALSCGEAAFAVP
jgi:hypothetical protein